MKLVKLYVCKGGKRKGAERKEKDGGKIGKKEGKEEIGYKVREKDGGSFLKGVGEKNGPDEDVECCPSLEGRAGGGSA